MITTSATLPFRTQRAGSGIAVLLLALCGATALLFISSIVSPHWVQAGWDDNAGGGTNTSAPLAWSPFYFCRGSYCTTLPSDATGILPNTSDCIGGSDAPLTRSQIETRLRGAQALTILSFFGMSLATALVLYLLSTLLSTQSTLRRIDAVHDAACGSRRGKKRYTHEPAATTSEMPFATSPHPTVSRDVSSGERGDGGGDRRDPNRGLTASSRKRRADVTPPPISSIISNTSGTDTHRRQFPHIEVIVATSSSLTSSSPVYSLPAEMVAASLVEFDVEETRRALQASIDHFIVWNRPTGSGGSASVVLSPTAAEDRIHTALVGLEATRCRFATSPHDRLVSMPRAGIALLMALFLSTLFAAVSIGVFDKLQNGELHCGADYCTSVLGVLAGNPCGRGAAYRSFLAGTIMSGISLFIGLVLAIVFHRPVRAATEFTDQFYIILTNVCSEREEELRALQVSLEAARAAGPRPPPPTVLDGRSSVRRGGSTVYVPPTTSSHSVISGTVLASDYERDNLQRQEESPPPSARPSQERNVASAAGASFADLSKNAFSASPPQPSNIATLSSSGGGPSPTDRSQRAFSGGRLDEPGWVFAEEEQLFYHAARKLYYDPDSQQFYDPRTQLWWDGAKWYLIEASQ